MDNKWNIGEGGDLPIGFGLSLAAHAKSMEVFSNMSDAQKEAVVEKSRHVKSRAEMDRLVSSLSEDSLGESGTRRGQSQQERFY